MLPKGNLMAVSFAKIGAHESVRVKILAYPGVYIKGIGEVGYGDVLHVPAGDAIFLIGAKRAEQVAEEPTPEPEPKLPESTLSQAEPPVEPATEPAVEKPKGKSTKKLK